jgi:hypothetical protein
MMKKNQEMKNIHENGQYVAKNDCATTMNEKQPERLAVVNKI